MPATNQFKAAGLSIGYTHKGAANPLTEDLNLSLQSGELVCLLGPNGAGKSTLIRTLAGIQKPLTGEVLLDGANIQSITPHERAKRISVVLNDRTQAGNIDVSTYVSLGRQPYSGWLGRLTSNDHACIQNSIRSIGAEKLIYRTISELSDGERQKVSIARALAQEASIMLLDEPTAFLDFPRKVELMQLLKRLAHNKPLSLLLTTHDLELAKRYADRIWILSESGALTETSPEGLGDSATLAESFGCAPELLESF
ncbi:MAG: ABC transporter ATP-binding protein [Lentimonas sp.]